MCELFAMSANQPTDVGRYLSHLIPRGGKSGPHADGWGVAYFEGRASRVFKDTVPAAESRYLSLLAKSRLKSTTVVAHIRRANPASAGRTAANTHPFEREWNGYSWIFAHNGKLPELADVGRCSAGRFQPLGNTDSELAFCMLLDSIASHIKNGSAISPREVTAAIAPVVNDLDALGEFNFILSNGEYLFVHAHTRLHVLEQSLYTSPSRKSQVLLATAPLTNENWRPLSPGGIRVYQSGVAAE